MRHRRRLFSSRAAVGAALFALAAALFGVWVHWCVVDPRNVGWLLEGADRGQSAAGLAAYLRAGHWPGLHEPLLAAPQGMGLLFTDSIPLLGLLLGPAAPLLPAGVQFLGVWLLGCVALQVGFAWLLVRPHAPDRLAALLATALLAGLPVLFNRYGHASLCAQWLVLWALWVFVDRERAGSAWWWGTVLGVAALVHPYLLLMTAAIWASAGLRALYGGGGRRTLAGMAAVAALVGAIEWWLGVFDGRYASTGTYGAFPMALDAWWNPANPGFTALIPSSAEDHGRGFEGLQYLGAGMLALVALAAMTLARRGERARLPGGLAWLFPAFAVLLLLAIGPQPIWRGQPLATLHLPRSLIDLLDPVRAAGRLAWPLTYTLAYAALIAVLPHRRATVLLAGALALQVIDLSPMLFAVRATSARADDPAKYGRTRDPRWQALLARSGEVQFQPAEPFRDLQLMEEITWRAIVACRPVRYFYASREAIETRRRIDADTADFAAGRLDPGRLYVLLDGRVPAALAGRVERIDGVAIIAPTAPAPPAICASSPRSAS